MMSSDGQLEANLSVALRAPGTQSIIRIPLPFASRWTLTARRARWGSR